MSKPATETLSVALKRTFKTSAKSGSKQGKGGDSPSRLIDARIAGLSDWRGETLSRVRSLIREADPEVVEAWKWRGVPVWAHAGIICTGETYKSVVKLTFAKGASLEDPSGLFNSSLEGNTRRAIDLHEGDVIDEKALKALIRAAVARTCRCERRLAPSALRRDQRALEEHLTRSGGFAGPSKWRARRDFELLTPRFVVRRRAVLACFISRATPGPSPLFSCIFSWQTP